MDRFKAATFASVANNLRYRASGESMMRSCDPSKHRAALRACGTAVMQVSRDCFADIRGQWQSFGAIAFAVGNHDLAASPIDVLKLQFGDFACPQAQASRQPLRVLVSQDARRRCTWSEANPFGNPVNRRPGTVGTADTSDPSIAPST